MSRNNGKGPRLDLKLNLSPPPRGRVLPTVNPSANLAANSSPRRSSTSSSGASSSPPSSCVSSESDQDGSPGPTSMVLVGCPRCLMYVMLSEDDPKCPKCKSTVLLDFLNDPATYGYGAAGGKKGSAGGRKG